MPLGETYGQCYQEAKKKDQPAQTQEDAGQNPTQTEEVDSE